MRSIAWRVTVWIAITCGAIACKKQSVNLREWKASDHANAEGEPDNVRSTGVPAEPDDDPRVASLALFRVQCASCHGAEGHGDGPAGMALHPADFSQPEFQASRTDDQLRASILYGRNAMPAFGARLTPEAITGLVRLVREMGGAK